MKNFMNKISIKTFASLVLFTCSLQAGAQKAELGVRIMPTFTSMSFKTMEGGTVSGQGTVGYGIGGFIGFNFTEHVGIQGEVIYTTLTQKYNEQNRQRTINLKYVNIPLLLSLNTGKSKPVNFNVVAGPQIGLSVGSSIKTTTDDGTDDTHAILSIKKSDLGVAYGAGIDFGLNTSQTLRLGLGFRGVFGLVDISDNSETTATDTYYVLDRTHLKTYSGYAGLSFLF